MSLLDNFLKRLGYVKAQVKPNFFPADALIPKQTEDRDQILHEYSDDISDIAPLNNNPQQISGNPQLQNNPEQDIRMHGKEDIQVQTPFTTDEMNKQIMPSQSNYSNEKPIRPFLDVEDVEEINPLLAAKMRQTGILRVDKDMFMERYKGMVKNAVAKKMSLSDYINGK